MITVRKVFLSLRIVVHVSCLRSILASILPFPLDWGPSEEANGRLAPQPGYHLYGVTAS